ncbi:mannitol dehydrogenase family protein [Roseibacterium sp. SDUM158017]|uniref:mannitol dehydrogenase family protein n=1 Tax=Roseicyclus salinarum TaxID=3036773 RepID=UPI0024152257|nr:mannitol dehydrogenase family protein [Roseibacterium sp. SDUM158017]MDG4646844.1 mannitol dehydrogenase family protein [Roseibacterium sp. SDUM158017]
MAKLVHLGLGNFHRAHQAWYTHMANATGPAWRITGVAMRHGGLRDAMAASGWAYDLGVLGNDGLSVGRIAVHDTVLVASETPARVLAALADPVVAGVTLTVTEKGYCLRPDGRLDTGNAAIRADLSPGTPVGAIGLLAHALRLRQSRGAPPLTILSCDNLSGNGRLLRRAVGDFIAAADMKADLLDHAAFPDTMVDRITPRTTEGTVRRMSEAAGRPVDAPVMTEAFTEWVIEDAAAGPLPDWARAGARFVPDVAPFERRKLLFLNAAHSALAYGGLLRGHVYVHEAIADPVLRDLVRTLWSEAAPLLPEFGPAEREAYLGALVARFSVAGMAHRLDQIAADGSVKLPQRIVPILRHHRFSCPAATQVVQAWWAVLEAREAAGAALDDPAEDALRAALRGGVGRGQGLAEGLRQIGLGSGDMSGGWPEGWPAHGIGGHASGRS